MKLLSFLVMGIGLALAGGGVYYAKQLSTPRIEMVQPDVSIIVAKRKLTPDSVIRPGDLAFKSFPPHLVPDGAFGNVEELLGTKEAFRYPTTTIYPGEPVVALKLFGLSEEPGFALPPGWRAITIGVDATDTVAGFVKPGERIDLFLIRNLDGKLTNSPLMEAVEVLAVDQNRDRESIGPKLGRTLTLKVETEDARRISLARRLGEISVALLGQDGGGSGGDVLDENDLPGLGQEKVDDRRFIWIRDGEGNREKYFLD